MGRCRAQLPSLLNAFWHCLNYSFCSSSVAWRDEIKYLSKMKSTSISVMPPVMARKCAGSLQIMTSFSYLSLWSLRRMQLVVTGSSRKTPLYYQLLAFKLLIIISNYCFEGLITTIRDKIMLSQQYSIIIPDLKSLG